MFPNAFFRKKSCLTTISVFCKPISVSPLARSQSLLCVCTEVLLDHDYQLTKKMIWILNLPGNDKKIATAPSSPFGFRVTRWAADDHPLLLRRAQSVVSEGQVCKTQFERASLKEGTLDKSTSGDCESSQEQWKQECETKQSSGPR